MDDNICGICHEVLKDDIQTLECGHKYHYDCILESYINDCKKNKYEKKCPYCRKKGGYLELKPNSIPLKDIHKEYYSFMVHIKNNNKDEIINYLDQSKCLSILKTGKNKGLQCSNKVYAKNHCKTHYNMFLKELD